MICDKLACGQIIVNDQHAIAARNGLVRCARGVVGGGGCRPVGNRATKVDPLPNSNWPAFAPIAAVRCAAQSILSTRLVCFVAFSAK